MVDEAVAPVGGEIDQPLLHLATERRHEVSEDDHVLRVHDDLVIVGHDDALDGDHLIGFHGTLDPAADLSRLHRSSEDPADRLFHDALKETLELVEPVHGGPGVSTYPSR